MLHQTILFLGQLWQLFEVSQILEFLRYIEMSMGNVLYMNLSNLSFSGKEILVGIGHNTNEKGATAVAEAFPEYFVIPIYMDKVQALHLKSVCSMAGKSVIAMSTSKDGEEVLKVPLIRAYLFKTYNIIS